MSTSARDKDIWRLRQIHQKKSALFPSPCPPDEESRIRNSQEYLQLQSEFDAIFAKYGFNPEIFKERAGSKRGVLQKIKNAIRRNEKRSLKQQDQHMIKRELDHIHDDTEPSIPSPTETP